MTSICHMANMGIMDVFRRMPSRTIDEIITEDEVDAQVLVPYMGAKGAKTTELHELGEHMSKNRRLRMEWRNMASKTNIINKSALDTIKEVVSGCTAEKQLEYANALMPTYQTLSIHYKNNHLLRWAGGMQVQAEEVPLPGMLKYKKQDTRGGAQMYDHAWLVVKEQEHDFVKFHPLVSDMKRAVNGVTPVNLFGYHDAGINDTLMLLETNEAARWCAEMPRYTNDMAASKAFVDDRGNIPTKESSYIKMRDVRIGAMQVQANVSEYPLNCRVQGGGFHHTEIKIHRNLDVLVDRGRIPGAQPHTSSRVIKCSPVQRSNGYGVMLSMTAALDHINMVIESSITCSKVDGLKGHQEKFNDNSGIAVPGLCATSNGGEEQVDPDDETMTRVLPFSNDLVQMNWAIDLTKRSYIDTIEHKLSQFNNAVENGHIPGEKIKIEDMPQQPLPCMGFPISLLPDDKDDKKPKSDDAVVLQMLSLDVETKPSSKAIEVSDDINMGVVANEILMNEVATSLGRKPTSGDVETYKMDRIGENYMWGVEGDLNSYRTWCNHLRESMIAKGNALPEGDECVVGMMDSELMLICRMHERRSQVEDSPEAIYKIDATWGQTYKAVIKQTKTQKCGVLASKKRSRRNRQPDGYDVYDANDPFVKKTKVAESSSNQASSSSSGAGTSGSSPMLVVTDMRDASDV